MKVLVTLALLGLAVAYPKEGGMGAFGKGLKHYDLTQLTPGMLKLEIPDSAFEGEDEECEPAKVRECVKCVHDHAKICVMNMHSQPEIVSKVAECEAEGSELADKDKAWQEKSLNWHKQLATCLSADRPAEPAEDSLFLGMRKKRSPRYHDHAGHGHSHTETGDPADGVCEHPTYEKTPEESEKCWREMRAHRDHCNSYFRKCSKLSACFGLGPEPEDESDKAWYTFLKAIVVEKRTAIVAHKRDLLVCTGKLPEDTDHETVKAHLWGDE
jgi:hypothetical protein